MDRDWNRVFGPYGCRVAGNHRYLPRYGKGEQHDVQVFLRELARHDKIAA